MSDDWLDLPELAGRKLALAALNDDSTPKQAVVVVPEGVDPDYAELIRALRRLRPVQRTFIRMLMDCNGRAIRALRRLRTEYFIDLTPSAVSRWGKNPDFARAAALTRKHLLKLADIDPVGLMLRAQEIADMGLEGHEVLDDDGNPTGQRTGQDLGVGLRSVELMMRRHGMLQRDENQAMRVTLEIVDLARREGEIIDVTPEPVLE